jgi:hypothetical protein
VFEVAKEFKEKNNLDHIYITEQGGWHALSNRDSVYKALKKYMKKKIDYSIKVASHHTTPNIYMVV